MHCSDEQMHYSSEQMHCYSKQMHRSSELMHCFDEMTQCFTRTVVVLLYRFCIPEYIVEITFLCTKSNTSSNNPISLHKTAFAVFASLENELSLLKHQFTSNQPLIVTGHSLGGSVASLFTLWLLDSLPRYGVQQLLCITYGSPLLGSSGFQKSISEHPTWSSCFLHVVSDKDPVPGFLISDHNASAANVTTPTCYVPFGTYLFCSESGFSYFEEPQSILELLMIMRSRCAESENLDNCSQVVDYGHILERLKNKAICMGISQLPDSISNPLQAATYLLLEATGVGKLKLNAIHCYLIKLCCSHFDGSSTETHTTRIGER
ncbi:hypothetical protein P3S68_016514 [Capsicum galapagoense]